MPKNYDIYDDEQFIEIRERIQSERSAYKNKYAGTLKFHSFIAMIFYKAGLITLVLTALSYFDVIDLPLEVLGIFYATSFYLIGYITEPTDGDRYEEMVKGIAEDMGNIRALIEFQSTDKQQNKD